ncbi:MULTISPECIES: HAMP domain-containing sensor histidine kinase [Halobacterium]|uniref:sensor histidine kinase n=1 Tax=Halobacterium TaxID=2239 RepID=UPI00073E2E18|nr:MULTISPECIES: HAMP domain-containing sensor histidine kinase [Halobacterium]MCG1002491.1 HAMP domain-containing histidine kinase [Halobacterium noricense]
MADTAKPDSSGRLAGYAVAALGALLFAVPLYDVWDDTTDLGWSLLPTLVENATLFALAGLVVAGGVWLARSQWDSKHVTTVAATTFAGFAATAALFAWIVAVQLWAMHELKPYVIALDAVVVGTLGSFGIGVYRARSESRCRALRVERNRLAGLFENTSDAVATVELADGAPTVASANGRFRETFADPMAAIEAAADLAGTSLSSLFDSGRGTDTTTHEIAYSDAAGVHEVAYGDRADRGDDAREFIVQFVPFDTDDGRTYVYVVATDVTEQKQLAREREANERLDLLHEYASKLVNADDSEGAAALAREAVEELYAPSAVRVVLDDDVAAGPADSEAAFDITIDVGDRGRIDVAADLAPRELNAVNVLATHLDDVLDRLDYERELADEREELDFINRTLRHNLLNDIQVVRARLQTLDGDEDLVDHRDVFLDHLDRMADFVQTMRTYTKSLVEDDEHVLKPVDLPSALDDVVDGTQNAYEDATVSLGDVPQVAVSADELLEPLLENVTTNAVEHNDKETPRVHVDAERHGDWVTVRVADNGPGVPDDRKDDVFERGELGEHSSGSGFGLFFVRKTVESYGGGVELRDNEPTGTVVRLTLPVAST